MGSKEDSNNTTNEYCAAENLAFDNDTHSLDIKSTDSDTTVTSMSLIEKLRDIKEPPPKPQTTNDVHREFYAKKEQIKREEITALRNAGWKPTKISHEQIKYLVKAILDGAAIKDAFLYMTIKYHLTDEFVSKIKNKLRKDALNKALTSLTKEQHPQIILMKQEGYFSRTDKTDIVSSTLQAALGRLQRNLKRAKESASMKNNIMKLDDEITSLKANNSLLNCQLKLQSNETKSNWFEKALILYFDQGMTHQQISQELNILVNTVKVRFKRHSKKQKEA